jgi:hypothetical protein
MTIRKNKFDVSIEGTYKLRAVGSGAGGGDRIVQWQTATQYVNEGSYILLIAEISTPFTVDTDIDLSLSNTSTALQGTDWEFRNNVDYLRFAAGSSQAAVQIYAKPDVDLLEPVETVILSIVQGLNGEAYTVGARHTTTLNIVQPTTPRVNFAETEIVEFEDLMESLFVSVALTEDPASDVVVRITANYISLNPFPGPDQDLTLPRPITDITFTPGGALTRFFEISITPDATPEADEEMQLTLSVVSGPCIVGALSTIDVTVVNDDGVGVEPEIQFNEELGVVFSIDESDTAIGYVTITNGLVAPAGGLDIPFSVDYGFGGSPSRVNVIGDGGIPGICHMNAGSADAQIQIVPVDDLLVQGPQLVTITLLDSTGYALGAATEVLVTIDDSTDVETPLVEFDRVSMDLISGSGVPGSAFGRLRVENGPNTIQAQYPLTVDFTTDGSALLGTDYQIFIESQPFTSAIQITDPTHEPLIEVRVIPDAEVDIEHYEFTLVALANCAIGTQNTLVGSILPVGATTLVPQFYFASEVFGTRAGYDLEFDGVGQVRNIIVDLGVVAPTNLYIDVDWYGPDGVTEGVHFDFPQTPFPKRIEIQQGQRYGILPFRVLSAGREEHMRRVIVEMIASDQASINEYQQQRRWTAVILGDLDDEYLVPPITLPDVSLDDFRVYADRIEDLYHGITIDLPFNAPGGPGGAYQAEVLQHYDRDYILRNQFGEFVYGRSSSAYDNGVAVAMHLAQKIWLDRNSPVTRTFGTRRGDVDVYDGETIYWLDDMPVKYLDKGVPVNISVYQQSVGGPYDFNLSGDGGQIQQPIGTICWGRNRPTGVAGMWHPCVVRDLNVVARGHTHQIRSWNATAFQADPLGSLPPHQVQSFLDNLLFHGFGHTHNPAIGGPSQPVQTRSVRRGLGNILGIHRFSVNLVHGLIHFNEWVWTNTDPYTPTPPYNFWFNLRANTPGSWIITNCTAARAERQFCYLDSTGPIFIFAYNTLETPGTGRSMLQLVARNEWQQGIPQAQFPAQEDGGGNSAGPCHGLTAIVKNETWGKNGVGTAGDYDLYGGHTGHLFFVLNRHRGELPDGSTGVFYNRRLVGFYSDSDQAGCYVSNSDLIDIAQAYHPDTPTNPPYPKWFAFRYVEIAGMDIDLDNVGAWPGWPVSVTSCYKFVFKPVFYANPVPPLNTNPLPLSNLTFGDGFIAFNYPGHMDPWYHRGAVLADPLKRPVAGQQFGPPIIYLPCRGGIDTYPYPGAIEFPDGVLASLGDACGSTRLCDYYRFGSSNFTVRSAFINNPITYETYDGRDLTPGP